MHCPTMSAKIQDLRWGQRWGMARQLCKLNARSVASIAISGRHSDGGGLYLNVTLTGARSWLFMWKVKGKRREMGLGSFQKVSLAKARELASRYRAEIADGLDPIVARRASLSVSFGTCADRYIEAKSPEWRNAKHVAQWKMTLCKYAASIRNMPVDSIGTTEVLSVLQPIWSARPETASRLRGRIEHVLDAARASGYRTGENPARWRGHLDKLLSKRAKLTRGHHAAMPFHDVPQLVKTLRQRAGVSALALEFLILTAARSGEVIKARWAEVDLSSRVWVVPAARMKAGREHRVPLTASALSILDKLKSYGNEVYIFSAPSDDRPISGMALEMLLRRMEITGVTIHGFRSSFRDWAGEVSPFPREVAEAALAHVIGDKAEQAYRRGDALEKRRIMMEAWSSFLEDDGAFKVVQFRKG